MNIANIFGLHLGCWVKINKTGDDEGKIINVSTSLSNIGEGIVTVEDLHNGMRTRYIKDCKLLLKPLSAISEDDKAEFVKEFIPDEDATKYWFEMTYNRVQLFGIDDFYDISVEETLWLASKGYDVGIVPDEYKEIYHGK